MPRTVLPELQLHPAIRDRVADYQRGILDEVQSAVATNDLVVVGMRQNPFPRKARKLLDQANVKYTYLEYGSYFSDWRRRLALKMWTGWPTLPMVFAKGTLIGGAEDLQKLLASGELAKLLAAPRA
ncbi:MAG TPA: glutaredoxin domain-containing protein [Burkholderiaceae bacterium]|nr:glutaredoxin domain-containing protein [Burkholderiaceae bacterium]